MVHPPPATAADPRASPSPRGVGACHANSPCGLDPAAVLSPEELELLHRKFALFNPSTNKSRSLAPRHALRLFRDDFPTLSEWELHGLFQRCDLNSDGQLSLPEYLHARAYHRLAVEAGNEFESHRSFTILDMDGDGIILADNVLDLVEEAKEPSARLLKQAIVAAAAATMRASSSSSSDTTNGRGPHPTSSPSSAAHEGEITVGHFVTAVRDANRQSERDVAAKTLRMMGLHDKQQRLGETLQDPHLPGAQRGHVLAKVESIQIEIDILTQEIARARRELITTANSALAKVCEALVATYENEQHVYECLSNLIVYCGLKDPELFRYKLEQSGRAVHVLDTVLMAPPQHVQQSPEYEKQMDLSLHVPQLHEASHAHHDAHSRSNQHHHPATPRYHPGTSRHTRPTDTTSSSMAATVDPHARLKLNSTLRKQFVFYTMAGNVTNLETMTRSNFMRFVKDCQLHRLGKSLQDAEIHAIFALATQSHSSATSDGSISTPRQSMYFDNWLTACELILEQALEVETGRRMSAAELEQLMRIHIITKAKCIPTQNIAPDISQSHVLKLLREHLWQFKQIFFHFALRGLGEVDSKLTLTMDQFVGFCRTFSIVRTSTQRDGEPYCPPPMTESPVIQPISLMEVIREYYAAKLDISFTDPERREAKDITFREFIRCIERIALAMHAHHEKKHESALPNGIFTTSFEALKEDEDRTPQRAHTPLYHRRGNLFAASPAKNCKMTSTSIISKLLRSSRAIASRVPRNVEDISEDSCDNVLPSQVRSHSPPRIVYRTSQINLCPATPVNNNSGTPAAPSTTQTTVERLHPRAPSAISPQKRISDSPRKSHPVKSPRPRPVMCGGPPQTLVVRSPPVE